MGKSDVSFKDVATNVAKTLLSEQPSFIYYSSLH